MNQLVKDALAASSNRDDLDGIDVAALAAAVHRYRSAVLLGVEAVPGCPQSPDSVVHLGG